MSIYVANESRSLGQFSSNAGYSHLIACDCGPALKALLTRGYSEEIPAVISDLMKVQRNDPDTSVRTTASTLRRLIQGQPLIIIHDGTSGDPLNKEVQAGGPGSGRKPGVTQWAIHNGKLLTRVIEDPKSYLAGKEHGENGEDFTHDEWFRRKGLPYFGKEFDKISRGVALINAPKPGQMTLTRSDLAEYLGDYNKNIPQEVYDHFKAKYPNHIFASIAAGGPG